MCIYIDMDLHPCRGDFNFLPHVVALFNEFFIVVGAPIVVGLHLQSHQMLDLYFFC